MKRQIIQYNTDSFDNLGDTRGERLIRPIVQWMGEQPYSGLLWPNYFFESVLKNQHCRHYNYPFFALEYIISGKTCYEHPRGTETVGAGELYLVHARRDSTLTVGREGCRKVVLIFYGALLPVLLDAVGLSDCYLLRPPEPKKICRAMRRIGALMSGQSPDAIPKIAGEAYQLLLELGRLRRLDESQVLPPSFIKVVNHIDTHLTEAFTIQELARKFTTTPTTLNAKFRRHFGLSPHQYLASRRIERAKLLLESGTLSVKEVAAQTGYPSAFHFSRMFKRAVGLAPSAYRNSAPAQNKNL